MSRNDSSASVLRTPPPSGSDVETASLVDLTASDNSSESYKEQEDYLNLKAKQKSIVAVPNPTWENLFDSSFILGENHTSISPKKFLVQNMALLKKRGFNAIFIEHLDSALDTDIAEYQKSFAKSCPQTPEQLKDGLAVPNHHLSSFLFQLKGASPEQVELYKEQSALYDYNEVVRSATKEGIMVIPIDDKTVYYEAKQRDRIVGLNARAVKCIEKELERDPELKFLAFVGAAHCLNSDKYDGDIVPGISESLAVPAVFMCDKHPQQHESSGFSSDEEEPQQKKMRQSILREIPVESIYDNNFPPHSEDQRIYDYSAMGLVVDISRDLQYEEGILPFYKEQMEVRSPFTYSSISSSSSMSFTDVSRAALPKRSNLQAAASVEYPLQQSSEPEKSAKVGSVSSFSKQKTKGGGNEK